MRWATVITDASFCHVTRAAGYAFWIRSDSIDVPIKGWGTFKERPRNSFEAELWAAMNGVHTAKINGADAVLLQTDNTGVVDAVQKRTDPKVIYVIDGIVIVAKHVKGHTGGDTPARWCNNWCDIWAKKAMRGQRGKR
jgi:ribonuclease HI